MDTKQKIIDEIKNGAHKSIYRDCIKKGCAFLIVVDDVTYEFRPIIVRIDSNWNPYCEGGAEAWSKDKTYKFKCTEIDFVWREELAENRKKRAEHLISLIPANITGRQRDSAVLWINHFPDIVKEENVKSMQPWDMTTAADDDVLESLTI